MMDHSSRDDTSTDDARLRALGEKLEARRTVEAADTRRAEDTSNKAVGLKYASEFAGAIIVATGLGYFLDQFAGTSPWGLLGGLALGTAAGMYSIVQSARRGMDQ